MIQQVSLRGHRVLSFLIIKYAGKKKSGFFIGQFLNAVQHLEICQFLLKTEKINAS